MISEFSGKYRFLSNFYPSDILYDGMIWPTVEHAYQAAKTDSVKERLKILYQAKTPGQAKRFGKAVTLIPEWELIKLRVMEHLLREKFYNPILEELLLETGNQELIEGNTWRDSFWGVCDGVGANHLGKLLMKIRDEHDKNGNSSVDT